MKNTNTKTCEIENCDRPFYGRSWCQKHYNRWYVHGDPEYQRKKVAPSHCSIDGCENDGKITRGWCSKHYQRWINHGDPMKTERIRNGDPWESFALRTEWQGECLVWTGAKDEDGYGIIWADGKRHQVHRYVWVSKNGLPPSKAHIDHECHNPSCANIKHLRLATPSQNGANRSDKQSVKASSGKRNVYRHGNRWRVVVMKNRKHYSFGQYSTIEEAAVVAEKARQELFGEFAGKG